MSATHSVELTAEQCDVLLRGLRYVRSAIMLEVRDPEPEDEARRSRELDEIRRLAERIEGSSSRQTADV